jgi:hypothetical protein
MKTKLLIIMSSFLLVLVVMDGLSHKKDPFGVRSRDRVMVAGTLG